MKEMTIEQKAKAYDEALKVAHRLYEQGTITESLSYIFSELKESEGEKIRKAIIRILKGETGYTSKEDTDKYVAWLEKQESVGEIVEKCKASWYNEGKIQGQIEGLSDEEKYQQGWHDALENQSQTFTKKDVDDAYLKGVTNAKNEIEKQYKATYQIRKCIATFIFNYRGDIKDRAKWMDYLGIKCFFVEKQDDNSIRKRYDRIKDSEWFKNTHEGMSVSDDGNEVEPKFKVGDWIVNNISKDVFLIKSINNGYCTLEDIKGNIISPCLPHCENESHLWTIQDAKNGDVLTWDNSKCIALFKNIYDKESFNSHGCVGHCTGVFEAGLSYHDIEGVHPATKDRCDLLFQKMKEVGYVWDAENKELKLLITNGGDFESENCGQKPAWSEEDRTMAFTLMRDVDQMSYISKEGKNERIGWLNSLDEKFASTESTWSEEDVKRFRNLISLVEYSNENKATKEGFIKFINKLKSLRPQNRWKPSDEQMEALRKTSKNEYLTAKQYDIIVSLYDDLKKKLCHNT